MKPDRSSLCFSPVKISGSHASCQLLDEMNGQDRLARVP